jgi:hypothetical protein
LVYVSSLQGSIGELLDASLELAKRQFWTILRAALPALALTACVEVLLEVIGASPTTSMIGFLVPFIPWALAEALALGSCWHLLHGESATFADSWALVSRRIVAIALTYTVKWLLILPGLFLLIVPGLYLIALFFALPTVSVTEQASFREAFRRSRALARHRLKRIVGTLGLLEIMGLAVAALVPVILPGGTWEAPSAWDRIGGWVVGIVMLPIRAALMTVLYLHLRVSKEGYDLQWTLSHLPLNSPGDR